MIIILIMIMIMCPYRLALVQALLVETGGAVVAHDQFAPLGADEAPVGVHVGRPSPLLALGGRGVVLGADDVSLGQLDRARGHAVVTCVIGGGAAETMHQLLIVLHYRVTRVLTGARVTRVIWAVHVTVDNLVLGPDGELGQTRVVEVLTAPGHVAAGHVSVALPAHRAHVSPRQAGLAFELVRAHLVADPGAGRVEVGGAGASTPPHLAPGLLAPSINVN